jgi:hypothetical protein
MLMQDHFPSISSKDLETAVGGKEDGKPGAIAKAVYGGMVAVSILAGSPGGQRHDDRASGSLHSPQATASSQAK